MILDERIERKRPRQAKEMSMDAPVQAVQPVSEADATQELQLVQPTDHEADMFQSQMGMEQSNIEALHVIDKMESGILTKNIQAIHNELKLDDD
jgi:hypothetical protein